MAVRVRAAQSGTRFFGCFDGPVLCFCMTPTPARRAPHGMLEHELQNYSLAITAIEHFVLEAVVEKPALLWVFAPQ